MTGTDRASLAGPGGAGADTSATADTATVDTATVDTATVDTATVDLTGRRIVHHRHLLPATVARLFARRPHPIEVAGRADVAACLGASLYMPGLRRDLAASISDLSSRLGATSVVLCLEDSVPDDLLEAAEANLLAEVEVLEWARPPVLIFVRPRSADHLRRLADRMGEGLNALAGFVLPKFSAVTGDDWLDAVAGTRRSSPHLLAMPILEGPEILSIRDRHRELLDLQQLLKERAELIAAIRIGATDLSGMLGIRRGRASTVYDLPPIAAVIGDIVSTWGGPDSSHAVTGAVWEYYRPLNESVDQGLIRETERDIECGMVGKSVIHPSHVPVVNALLTVTWEDWSDANRIVCGPGGASASTLRGRMNEAKPHRRWAEQILRRSEVFGVLTEGVEPYDLVKAV